MNIRITVLVAAAFTFFKASAQDRPVLYAQRDHGIPAIPYEVVYQQPNGQNIKIRMKGDGLLHWAVTSDGYKLIKNQEGSFCYAVEDNNNGMKASAMVASDVTTRSNTEQTFLKSLSKDITYSKSYIAKRKASQNLLKSSETPQKAFPTTGSHKLLCILVNFQDVQMIKKQTEFNDLFNKSGYNTNGSTGSVKDYFYDNSFQQMNLTVDVVGPFTISNSRAYYGGNNSQGSDSNPQAMVTEAVKLADKSGVDFSQYDNDKDGTIDGVYVIFAGNGEEAGASADAIWSHAWQIPTLKLDGVNISAYSCSPELYGSNSSYITTIGVICHEFSHVCGLPDYYDTDYEQSGGESENLGNYDIMAGGSWNNNGRTPPYTNSYSRWMLGWGDLKSFQPQVNNSILPHYSTPYGYKISNKANESFIFENRQKVKWDAYIPGHGMIAYHVVYNASVWDSNEINVIPTKEYFELIDASKAFGANSKSSPFPGESNITTLSSGTSPAMINWDGSSLKMSLLNIKEANEIITTDIIQDGATTTTLKLMNGATPLANVAVSILGETFISDSNGNLTVPLIIGNTTASISFKDGNTFNYTFTMNLNGTTALNFKKIVAVAKPRIGTISNVTLNVSSYAKINVSSANAVEFYVPFLGSRIDYNAQLNSIQNVTGNIVPSNSTTDTIKLCYNTYTLRTITYNNKSMPGTSLKSEDLTFNTDSNGIFVLFVPTSMQSTTISLISNEYIATPLTIDNQKGSTLSYNINMVKSDGDSFVVAPNPISATDPINIYSKVEDATAHFYTLSGVHVLSTKIHQGLNPIDRSKFSGGLYLLKIDSKEETYKSKIVVL